jgi:hypothetical protein
MKKIITLLYFQLCVDILGFPVYYEYTKTSWEEKVNNNIDKYFFNRTKQVVYNFKLIKQL